MRIHPFTLLLAAVLSAAAALQAAEKPNINDLTAELKGERPAVERTAEQLDAVYGQVLDALVADLGSDDVGKRGGPASTLERIAFHASRPGADAQRAACSKAIAARLGADVAPVGRAWLMRQLERIGRAEAVSQLAKALADQDALVRESARRALQKNPAKEANTALQQALGSASAPAWRVALLNALAERRDAANLDLLAKDAAASDDNVRTAAVIGLSKLGDKAGAAPIAAAMQKGSAMSKAIATDSYVRLADALVAAGDKAGALSIYKTLLSAEGHLKCAAIIGIGRAGATADLPTLLQALAGQDARVRGACVEALCLMQGADVTNLIVAKVGDSKPEAKLALLQALARRGDKAALPVFTAAVEDADEAVQGAALIGLGKVGNAGTVPLLLKAAAGAVKTQQEAARQSLLVLPGAEIDKALLSAMGDSEPKTRAEAIRALAARHAVAATAALLKAASDADSTVRNEALKALGVVAAGDALARLAAVLVKTEDDGSRNEAANALVLIANRAADMEARAEPIAAALASSNGPARLSLLSVLGKIGGQKSLEAVRAAVKSSEAKVKEAGIRALADWPDALAAADLLDIVKTSAAENDQVVAFRGYVRVCRIRTTRPEAETARMLAAGLAVAKRADQKREALGGLAEARDILALQAVLPCIDDKDVREEAASAAVRIGRDICDRHPEAVKAAMEKVLAVSSSEHVKGQGKETLDRAEQRIKERKK
jgi:HEAT repeat protein